MLTTLLIVVLSQTSDASLGDVGESCRARSDCRAGLKCVNAICTAPVTSTKEGQACEATSDCSADGSLRCVARVCRARGAGQTASALTPPPAPPEAYVPANARLSEPPPVPSRSATLVGDAPRTSFATTGGLTIGEQMMQLEAQIDSINTELRGINTNWPGGSIALVVIGAVLSPLALVGLPLLLIPWVGIPVLLVGLGGVAMIVGGIVGGSRHSAQANARREELIQQRQGYERELSNLKRLAAMPVRADAAMVKVASF